MAKRPRYKATRKDLEGLDDEVKELISPHIVPVEMLDSIGVSLCSKRDEAKAGRSGSNIEATWIACEEAYVGIDDANRSEWASSKWVKPISIDGPVTSGRDQKTGDAKSTVFVRMTSRYVDAGAAKLSEILLPVDDKPFSIKESPEPHLTKAMDNQSQVVHDGMGNVPLTRPAMPHEMAAMPGQGGAPPTMGDIVKGAPPPDAPRVPLTVADLAEENMRIANKSAKAAETRIQDWLVASFYPAEIRKVIFDAARVGVGIMKGPYPKASRSVVVRKGPKGVDIQIVYKVVPSFKWIKYQDFFPDPSCGENINDGDYLFERDDMTDRQLRALKKEPGYIGKQIDKCIDLGPKSTRNNNSRAASRDQTKKENRYEIWYYYGTLTRDEMSCICNNAGKPLTEADSPSSQKVVYAIVTLVDDIVVKASINPLDTGSYPYSAMPWQRRAGSWAGIGISEQLQTPQKMINGATRAMMDNAGIAAGPQVVIDMASITPADGRWGISPNKLWYLKRGGAASPNGVKDAFATFELPNTTDPLMKIVDYSLKLAEESTSIPLITQGQTGATTPETYGASQLQDTNANQLLRAIGYTFDDYVTEPLIVRAYEWLLLDPDVPDDEKGNFKIEAHGSTAIVERAIQDQTIAQMGNMVLNPNYGLDPKRWAKMMLRSKRINPTELSFTKEELKKIEATPPPKPPQVEAANIRAQSNRETIASKQSSDQRTADNERQIAQAANELDGARIGAEKERTLAEATVNLHELRTKHEIAMMEHATKRGVSIDQVKASLMKEAMKLDTALHMNAADRAHEHQLSHQDRAHEAAISAQDREHDMKKHKMTLEAPPAQTPGKAKNGKAFEQG